MRIHFVLVGEGTSDGGLIPHLETLCVFLGADEVTGTAVDFRRVRQPVGHTVEAKLRAALQLEPGANLFFVHRDADGPDPALRRAEIERAVASARCERHVAVVPVQETEAWLLLDEEAIREVAGRPRGREPLDLPRPAQVEGIGSPKERLREALLTASQSTGRRRERFLADFGEHRRILLQRLPIGGALEEVPSWVRLREELARVLERL